MAEQRDLSLATVFTANVESFRKGTQAIRRELNALNTAMAKGAKQAAGPMNDLQKVQALYAKRVKEMAPINNTYKRALDDLRKSTDGTARSHRDAIRYMDQMQAMVHKQARALSAAGKNGRKFAQDIDYVNLVAKDQAGLLERTAQGFRVLDSATKKAGQSQSWIGKQIAQVEGAMARLTAAMKVTAAYGVAAAAIYAVVDALRAGFDEIVAYDQALKNLKAITGATDAEVRAMGETIKQVARTTKFSMTETADAMVLLGQAGFDAGESMDAIQATADLATGTLSDMKTVADLLTTSVRAFNLESFQAGQISDIMANAINKSKLTVDKLRIAFNYVGPAAYAVGAEIEEVTAAMMTLANSGLRASTIGTGLRQVFSRLVAPSAKLREAYEEHNIQLEDLDVRAHGFVGVMENLAEVFVDSTTGAIDARKAFELFGLRGANSIVALMRAINSGEFNRALDSVYEVGTAANMAGIQIEGLALQFKNLQDRFKSLMVELGALGFTDVLRGFLEVVRQTVIALTAFVEQGIGGAITTYTTFTATTGIATIAVLALGKAIYLVTKRIYTFSAALLKHPIGWLVLAVGAAAAAYKRFQTQIRSNTQAEQQAVIATNRRIEILKSYQDRLKKANEEAEKSEEGLKRYRDLIKRLKTEFEDLEFILADAGENFEDLNDILQQEITVAWFNNVSAAVESIAQQFKVIEKTKVIEGFKEMFSAEMIAGVNIWQYALKKGFDSRNLVGMMQQIPILGGFIDHMVQRWKDLGEIVSIVGDMATEKMKEWGESTEKVKQEKLLLKQLTYTLGESLFTAYEKGIYNAEELHEWVEILNERYAKFPNVLKAIKLAMERVDKQIQESIERMRRKPLVFEKVDSPFEEMIKGAKGLQQAEIAAIYRSMKQQVSAYKKTAKDIGVATEEQAEHVSGIRFNAMMEAFDIMHKERALEFENLEAKLEYIEKHKNAVIASLQEQIAADKRTRDEMRKNFKKGTDDRMKHEEELKERIEGNEKAIVGVTEEAQRQRNEITQEAGAQRLRHEFEQEEQALERRTELAKTMIEREGAEKKTAKNEIDVELARQDEKFAEERLRLLESLVSALKALYKDDAGAYIEETNAKKDAELKLQQARTATIQAGYEGEPKEEGRRKLREGRDLYESGKISAEEYFTYVQDARNADLISESEYQDQRAILMEGHWAAFKRGFDKARREVISFSKMFYDIASELPRMFADEFVDAFMEVTEGSKSFGEAMIDMFVNILKYIGQTIIQLTIMKMLMQGMSFLPGFGGGTGAQDISKGPVEMTMPDFHKGGLVGTDSPLPVRLVNPKIFESARRLHDGLKSNEFPAILQRGEGVFTKGQMKALGAQMSAAQALTINVPINVEHVSPRFTAGLRTEVESTVKRYIRTELV